MSVLIDLLAWPLPPPGPLAFVCEWTGLRIPESRTEVDAQVILDAAHLDVRVGTGLAGAERLAVLEA